MSAAAEKTPIFLSALVFPGAGQLLQRRWLAGALFSALFAMFLLLLGSAVIGPLIAAWDAAFQWAAHQHNRSFETISIPRVVALFVMCLLTYIINLVDVTRAAYRKPKASPLFSPGK